jgi:hypothetical protein
VLRQKLKNKEKEKNKEAVYLVKLSFKIFKDIQEKSNIYFSKNIICFV